MLPRSSAVRHGRRRAYFGKPPSQPCVPIAAGHHGEAVGGDLTTDELIDDELGPVRTAPLLFVSLTRGPD